MLVWNILLALVWCWIQGNFSAANIVGGFLLGFLVLALLTQRGLVGDSSYVRKVPRTIVLLYVFLRELLIANLRLAWEVITPGLNLKPAIIAYPLDAETDAEITLLASLITLTPGTLSMEVSPDRTTLFIHALYCDDEEALVKSIKRDFEARILEVLR